MNIVGTPPDYANPDFESDQAIESHNWKGYLTPEMEVLWTTFSEEQQAAIARMCHQLAMSEEQ